MEGDDDDDNDDDDDDDDDDDNYVKSLNINQPKIISILKTLFPLSSFKFLIS